MADLSDLCVCLCLCLCLLYDMYTCVLCIVIYVCNVNSYMLSSFIVKRLIP